MEEKEIMQGLVKNNKAELQYLASNKLVLLGYAKWFKRSCCKKCQVMLAKQVMENGKPDLSLLCEDCQKSLARVVK